MTKKKKKKVLRRPKLPEGLVKATDEVMRRFAETRETATLHECIFIMHGFDPWLSTAKTFPEGSTKYGFAKSYEYALEICKKGIEAGEISTVMKQKSKKNEY